MTRPIVVGVDGSSEALQAVDWAVDEARYRRSPVRIVHIALRWEYSAGAPPEPGLDAARPEAAALHVLELAEERARERAPEVEVSTRLGIGHVPRTLLEEAHDAVLLAVASRGTGAFSGIMLGSVSRQVAEHATCPVVVVPHHTDPEPRHAEVVVGVDGSEASMNAVGFALEAAATRQAGVRALHVWEHSAAPRAARPASYSEVSVDQEGMRLLVESLAPWKRKYPTVPVVEQVVQGRTPTEALSAATVRAALLVVGARGHGGFSGLRLGSVSHAVLQQAQGPVAVVHSGS
ncbi:universal stress protein [Actinocorallia populi]|uniref:universal stress protein n=1 Tax=Actinocorallia populi TaxID=2079200 RepID=UPI0018E5311B|nr:universal stress protein [Actinocorallia populi]